MERRLDGGYQIFAPEVCTCMPEVPAAVSTTSGTFLRVLYASSQLIRENLHQCLWAQIPPTLKETLSLWH